MARGKNLTVAQKVLLQENGYRDVKDWEYIGNKTVDSEGFKNTSKNTEKNIYQKFRNKKTGQEISIEV